MDAVGVFLLAGAASLVGMSVQAKVREAQRRSALVASQAETRRRRACVEVLQRFKNGPGFLIPDALPGDALKSVIQSGIGPSELVALLTESCQSLPGLPLGIHSIAGLQVPVHLSPERRARHVLIEGKSGTGKTTLIRNTVLADLHAGHGLGVLGPEAELFHDELLPWIPESRWDDVIYVDPADSSRPVPLNPLHLDAGEDIDLKVDEVFSIFRRLFEEDGGGAAPRMETILRKGLQVLVHVGGTLLDFERLLDPKDDSYRIWALQRISDERLRHFWTETYGQYPKEAHLPLVNRLERFLQAKVVRNMLCQPGKSLNVRRAMDEGKVILFNLSDGLLGEANAQILGSLIVAKIQTSAMSRANISPEKRRPWHFYVDEFQSFIGGAASSYQALLSRARKYRVSIVLAHQQLGQIPEDVLREIFGNVGTIVAFRVSATDARRLSREFIGEIDGAPTPLDPKELLSLGVGEAWARVGQSVFFLKTAPPLSNGSVRVRECVIQRSRQRYGETPFTKGSHHAPQVAEGIETLDPGAVF